MEAELVPGRLLSLYFDLLHHSPRDDGGPGAVCAVALSSLPGSKAGMDTPPTSSSLRSASCISSTWHTQKGYDVGCSVFPTLQVKQIWDPWRLSNFPKVKCVVGRGRTYCGPFFCRPFFFHLLIIFSWVLSSPALFPPPFSFRSCSLLGKMRGQGVSYTAPPLSHASMCLDVSAGPLFPGGP